MKLSRMIHDVDGTPTFRIEPPPRYEPKVEIPAIPQKGTEALRTMFNADAENRANAMAWMHYFRDAASDLDRQARMVNAAADRFGEVLSGVEL